jgi:glycosyltransferase involved in cell wall biosynthesis
LISISESLIEGNPSMNSLLVSIIIPYIDEHDFLKEAIASALAQGEVEKEIIIVCNAATIPEGYDPLNNNFKAVRFIHEPTQGSAYARNAGLHAAHGEWIQFLDVDDLLLPGKIKRQLAYDDADVIASPHTYQFVSGKKVSSAWEPDDVWSALLAGHLGSTSSMLWRRSALLAVGGWNESYFRNQEYELLFRLLKTGFKVACCPDHLTLVRERRKGSITKTTRHQPWFGINLREEIWSYFQQHDLSTPRRYDAFRKFIFKNVRALYRVNPGEAKELHEKYFKNPPYSPSIPYIPFYTRLYKSLGFEQTEKMIAQYRYLRDSISKLFSSTAS